MCRTIRLLWRSTAANISLDENDARLAAYMRVEEIDCTNDWRGYCAVAFRNHTIGWDKAVLKNHLSKGFRTW